MLSKKHSDTAVELSKPYEENEIQLKGILGFAVGLFLLIVVTFALMWALLNVLKDYQKETAGPANPMVMNAKDRLPPEPRLQLAPGFGVDSEHGRVNMELVAPQAEYRELHKQWLHLWEEGQKDQKTGTVISMPIHEAKEKFLEQSAHAGSGAGKEAILNESRSYVTDASSGRLAAEKRR